MNYWINFFSPVVAFFVLFMNLYLISSSLLQVVFLNMAQCRVKSVTIGSFPLIKRTIGVIPIRIGLFSFSAAVGIYGYDNSSPETETDTEKLFYTKPAFTRAALFVLSPVFFLILLLVSSLYLQKVMVYVKQFFRSVFFLDSAKSFLEYWNLMVGRNPVWLTIGWNVLLVSVMLTFPFSIVQGYGELLRTDFSENKSLQGILKVMVIVFFWVALLFSIFLVRIIWFSGGWAAIGFVVLNWLICQLAVVLVLWLILLPLTKKQKVLA
ncbi:hypothetical protein [Xanthocytophaga agilis]|uniref:Uncharacterized protein n=1 Tax=Xanthocytophaga agilis TaxID=3048010 RepID=A0AAE3R2J3_9BACT|nr:hypothetical protein [Xanthocytophaga agilis]MDJ1499507.1 hypothetical protein [Xanthocytophaga agilis]